MNSQVLFIGGIHGAGKTTICSELMKIFSCRCVKQRHLLMDIGKEMGLVWENIAERHDEFIEEAANRAVNGEQGILLVDCHYAIRSTKALRLKHKPVAEKFIPDLDDKFVAILERKMKARLILVQVDPQNAVSRFSQRPLELLDFDNTFEGLSELMPAEMEMFKRKTKKFGIKAEDQTIIDNNGCFEDALSAASQFFIRGL